jgi:hypothetical protein
MHWCTDNCIYGKKDQQVKTFRDVSLPQQNQVVTQYNREGTQLGFYSFYEIDV